MPEAYPFTLPSFLKSGKSRSQPAKFSQADPRRGPGYKQGTGTDVPVFWDLTFLFKPDEAIAFQLWGTQKLNNWMDDFVMPIRTEFGLLDHVCSFLPDTLLPVNEDGPLFRYTAKIMARAQIIPDAFKDAADLIIGLPNWRLWADYLDVTVNQAMPEA
ncbi:hypothetical protein [Roseateles sp.]|uniref:hypothetical protein n=1 Tax=Roseateles sp. TaxID=1971397 RepID=UPI0031D57CCD